MQKIAILQRLIHKYVRVVLKMLIVQKVAFGCINSDILCLYVMPSQSLALH